MINLRRNLNIGLDIWDNKIREISKKGATERDLEYLVTQKLRWRCRNDLFFLCQFTGQDKISQFKDFYEPFCDEVSLMNWQITRLGIHKPSEGMLPIEDITDNWKQDLKYLQRLYLCFRTFWKTTIVTKVHSLQLLLNFPNIHIVLAHNKQSNASDNLIAVKNMFLTTNIQHLFPECIPKTKDWGNMQGFSLANRTDKSRSEDNIEAIGVDTEVTGRHWQIAKKNDLVTEKSVGTEDQIKKSLDWDERFNIGLFDNPEIPLQDYEGTRYHFSDMYSKLQSNKRIKLVKVAVLSDFKDNSSCPIKNRFTEDGIKELKEKDPWTFWCQMMLEPKDPARMRFTPEMIKYYSKLPAAMNHYLLVDPASARKKKSDYTVMMVVGLNTDNNRYIVDCVRDKLDPKQRIDEALRLAFHWKVKGIGWEAIGFQSTDCHYFEEARRLKGLKVTPQEIKSHSSSKEDRIRSLIPEYVQGKWFWPPKGTLVQPSRFSGKSYDITTDLELEFLHFPLAEHDDILDTMTFINLMETIKPLAVKEEKESQGLTYGQYAALKDNRLRERRENRWGVFTRVGY